MASCADLTSRLQAVIDPWHFLDTDGTAGPDFLPVVPGRTPIEPPRQFDYRVHVGAPQLPERRPVVRRPVNAQEAAIIVWLLLVYYSGREGREALRTCAAAQGLYHTAGRADALSKLASYLRSERRNPAALDAISAGLLQTVLVKVFEDPSGGRLFGRDDAVVAAATEVIEQTRFFDRAVWLPLWAWALGGPAGSATVRTRVFAMKTLQAILARGSLFPQEVRAADPMAEVLRQLVVARAPNIPANARELYLAEAQALVGAIAHANAAAAIAESGGGGAPIPPTRPAAVPWWAPVGAAVAAVAAGLALLASR